MTRKVIFQTIGLLKPKLSKDGNMWCFLFGINLVEGVAGFGETPYKAAENFCNAFMQEKINLEPTDQEKWLATVDGKRAYLKYKEKNQS